MKPFAAAVVLVGAIYSVGCAPSKSEPSGRPTYHDLHLVVQAHETKLAEVKKDHDEYAWLIEQKRALGGTPTDEQLATLAQLRDDVNRERQRVIFYRTRRDNFAP